MFKKDTGPIDIQELKNRLTDCPDIDMKQVHIEEKHEAYFIYIVDQVDKDIVQRDFMKSILNMSLEHLSDKMYVNNIPCCEIKFLYDTEEVINDIMLGSMLFVSDKLPYGISYKNIKLEKRNVEEPITEKNMRGPHEGFIEILDANLSILRRKIHNDKLKFKLLTVGSTTRQKIAIVYIDGITNYDLVNVLYEKISNVKLDGSLTIGYVEECISSHPNSLFPQFLTTERPDKATSALLEGKIVIIQEGTPVVLIAPVTFISFFQAVDDYSTLWVQGSFLRFVRIFGSLVIAIFLPAFYIAITSYHYHAVPLTLLITLAESRSKVPFPPIIEVLILEFTVELIREAAIRLPTYLGTAISLFAGLIIGQAAVQAGIVSGLVIVIVGATAIASYVIPSHDMALAIRILRFVFIIVSAFFGMIGIVACTGFTVAHLISIDSLGQPYFSPFSPLAKDDLKDTFFRFPLKYMKKRPETSKTQDDFRGDND
ncbi:MAG: spore germination protein [Acetivibrionales bacterium]